MKRYVLVGLIIGFSIAGVFIMAKGGGVHAATVQNTKHDLSAPAAGGTGPGPIRSGPSGGTSEICVFCHTPHGSAAASFQAPLWNKNLNTPAYQVYTSDVMGPLGLNYPAAEQPLPSVRAVHLKSRLCLTCHDGTIALGTLANLPSGFISDIPMSNAGAAITNMPTTAEGYIGVDLSDDHPIAIQYTTVDPELNPAVPVPPTAGVKVFPSGGNNYVECTSCHDPHEDTNPKFLVATNLHSQICTTCHQKNIGSATPAHDNSTASYNPNGTGSIGTQVGTALNGVFCMNCHYPHKAGVTTAQPNTENPPYGRYLLTFQEEQSCFNNTNRWGNTVITCHGINALAATKNIESLVNGTKSSAHRVGAYGSYSGIHQATEAQAFNWLSTSQWHVDCSDCHNSHTAGNTNHTPGTNVIGNNSPLYGAGIVDITSWPAQGVGPVVGNPLLLGNVTAYESLGTTTSTSMPAGYYEFQICLKCHSSFAWNGGAIPSPPTGMTDQALEFNRNNLSYHPVVQANPNRYLGLPAASLTGGFAPGNTMYCSDCHGNDTPGGPQGPHGSNAFASSIPSRFMLASNYTDVYSNAVASTLPLSELCFKCHSEVVYQSGAANQAGTGFMTNLGTNLHTQHRIDAPAYAPQSTYAYRCVNCHAIIPHGYNRKAMIVLPTDPSAATYTPTGGPLIATAPLALPGNYADGFANRNVNCTTTTTGCHQ